MIRYNRDKHHRPFGNAHGRRSIRLQGYDYSQAGLYFITICTKDGEHLFGEITDGKMVLNAFGKIADNEWLKTGEIRDNVELSEYVIMPNHIHGIIVLNDLIVGAHCNVPLHEPQIEQFGKSTKNSIPTIVKLYKSAVTKKINILRNTPGIPVWQRNYYEHIIRNEKS
ncbi:MAG TPA: transposase [Desulfobacterales bacterium]|nr:transposase [Desulfobacterales bacterium]